MKKKSLSRGSRCPIVLLGRRHRRLRERQSDQPPPRVHHQPEECVAGSAGDADEPHASEDVRRAARGKSLIIFSFYPCTGPGCSLCYRRFTGCPFCSCTWVGVEFDLDVRPSCPVPQPLLPNSDQPKQNWADR